MTFRPRKPAKSQGLDYLFAALGGTTAVARMFHRSSSTVSRWRTGDRPLPVEVARVLRDRAPYIASRLSELAYELKSRDIPWAEYRAQRARVKRRQAFFDRFGHWPERRDG
jgi:hypothetical protein